MSPPAHQAPAQPPQRILEAGFTSPEWIDWVIQLDEPARRNLLITQGYHDLSQALADALGHENGNWCTFATWASGTAGRFIRSEEVPEVVRIFLGRLDPIEVTLAHVNAALVRLRDEMSIERDGVIDVLRGIVHDVAQEVAAGNLEVFGELAPLFSRALAALRASTGSEALDALADSLHPGLSERGGQALLSRALRTYAAARAETDERRKAALMLLANGHVGLHEQIRLQPFIAAAIDAPVRDALAAALEEVGEGLPRPLAHEVHAIVSRAIAPIADHAESEWQEISTRELMTLHLPDAELMLGRDLPAPPGMPLYPAVLDPVADPETQSFLAGYGASDPLEHGAGAHDWVRLSERMRYILELFRSRQRDARLFDEPLSDARRADARGIGAETYRSGVDASFRT